MSFKQREILEILEPKKQWRSFLIECHFSSFSPVLCIFITDPAMQSVIYCWVMFWWEKKSFWLFKKGYVFSSCSGIIVNYIFCKYSQNTQENRTCLPDWNIFWYSVISSFLKTIYLLQMYITDAYSSKDMVWLSLCIKCHYWFSSEEI